MRADDIGADHLRLETGLQTVLVVGMGRSGLAAARLLSSIGRRVLLSDARECADPPGLEAAIAAGARVLPLPQDAAHLEGVHLVVKSPGVPGEVGLIVAAHEAGIPVWSEVELAFRTLPVTFNAVTGTNGKTTTTALLGHMFETARIPVRVLGNIGTAITGVASEIGPGQELVVELSSFQLEDVHEFRPAAGVLLNLTPDHLDRHGTMERYLDCKAKMFARQVAADHAVFNLDDPWVSGLGHDVRSRADGPRVTFFSTLSRVGADSWLEDGYLHLLGGATVAVSDLPLRGRHNMENCLAAATMALVRSVPVEAVLEGLRTFPGVPHRLESAGVVRGVAYVNDSKATNVEATLKAIAAYPAGTHLILGGRDKASDYRPIARACVDGCRAVYLIGEAAPLIGEAFERVRVDEGRVGVPRPSVHADLETALAAAGAAAGHGETVLLAPACASFDQYADFEERGRHFMEIVKRMGESGR
ncbi:MAG: UDP-N-acetylmuramoyl-L-alanine--D-glutamate ligase [Actinobacteria bacterium]|nr:UDP-N-acetylmuramoyl-L-alanine--D-glutamate ligase [Actinomycetota bacterium]